MKKRRSWVARYTPQFIESYHRLSPERQNAVDKGIQRILKDPYVGEPSRPCPMCGEYFFHSDGKCPFCGHVLDTRTT